jgi:hypothetical protein
MPAAAPQEGAGAGTDFSQTNVQEQGVDEPDVVKTNGRHLFALAGNRVQAVKLGDGGPKLVDVLPLAQDLGAQSLLLRGDRLIVIATTYSYSGIPEPMPMPMPAEDTGTNGSSTPSSGPTARPAIAPSRYYGDPKTTLVEVDVSDPSDLKVARTLDVDGSFLDARVTGDTARIVINAIPDALQLDTPEEVRAAPAKEWLPTVVKTNRNGRKLYQRAVTCDDVRHAPLFSGLDALTVLTFDLDRGLTPVDTDALYTNADTVYASQTGLYLTTQRWTDKSETALHKFDASKRGETRYLASGVVDGTILNQYALSEHEGRLRVATTVDDANDLEGESRVTVFQQYENALARIGEVTGLGRGERIYAVRFIGETGYVVTFRQTDPLYTIDLSKPSQPRVAGELKILGYSAYLHPVGDDLLLGVGQDATEEGRVKGAQVSLFDVRNPASPVRLAQHGLGLHSQSEAEFDPHAFLWWAPASLAVIPVQSYSDSERFSGAIGLKVGRASGIAEAGRVQHDQQWPVRRSLVAGGKLYTVSDFGVRASSLDDLSSLGAESFSLPR